MNKQIEEMARTLCGEKNACAECVSCDMCEFRTEASVLYNAGYRKQSEGLCTYSEEKNTAESYTTSCVKHYKKGLRDAAREIFKDIENLMLMRACDYGYLYHEIQKLKRRFKKKCKEYAQ